MKTLRYLNGLFVRVVCRERKKKTQCLIVSGDDGQRPTTSNCMMPPAEETLSESVKTKIFEKIMLLCYGIYAIPATKAITMILC